MVSGGEVYGAAFSRGLRPAPIVTVSEWADRHRILSGKAANEKGPWRTSRTPYLREIMDELSVASPVREVIFVKGSQVGGTEALQNWIGYAIDYDPAPMLYVLPTDVLCRRASRTRIGPLIEDSPRLAAIVSKPRSREGGNSLLEKDYPGGVLVMTGAQSASSLRSTPIKRLLLDEIDAFPLELEAEGDPVVLAERGTRNYPGAKIAKVSTPTDETSRIMRDWERSDQSRFFVPCPDCGHFQVLRWKREDGARGIVYELDDAGFPVSVHYACESCGVLIPEHRKTFMLERGVWRATFPERSRKIRGFHLSALYSPLGFYSWTSIVEAFEKARKDPTMLRVWINQTLGEPWKEKSTAPKWERLYNRREHYERGTAPPGVCLITAGIDVQGDRLEIEIVGWGRGLESWSIDYQVLVGDPAHVATWRALERELARTFSRGELDLPVRMAAIDSQYETAKVKTWVRAQDQRRVVAIRGVEGRHMLVGTPQLQDVRLQSGRKVKRSLRVWPIDVGEAKGELYAWLRAEQPTNPKETGYPRGYCHFPQYGEEYFRQLTAERLALELDRRGHRRYAWTKSRERNEALDCRVYARAAVALCGVDRWTDEQWDQAEVSAGVVRSKPAPRTQGETRRRRRRPGDERPGFDLDRFR